MKGHLLFGLGLAIGITPLLILFLIGFTYPVPANPILDALANVERLTLPLDIADGFTIYRVTVQGNTLTQWAQSTNPFLDVDPGDPQVAVARDARRASVKVICSRPDLRGVLIAGAGFEGVFEDRKGSLMGRYVVTAADCSFVP